MLSASTSMPKASGAILMQQQQQQQSQMPLDDVSTLSMCHVTTPKTNFVSKIDWRAELFVVK